MGLVQSTSFTRRPASIGAGGADVFADPQAKTPMPITAQAAGLAWPVKLAEKPVVVVTVLPPDSIRVEVWAQPASANIATHRKYFT